jgi:hypothetical protein
VEGSGKEERLTGSGSGRLDEVKDASLPAALDDDSEGDHHSRCPDLTICDRNIGLFCVMSHMAC